MSRWQVAFENHQFKSTLDSLSTNIDSLQLSNTSSALEIELARLRKVQVFLEALVASLDLDLVPPRKWDEALPSLSACVNEIVAFSGDGAYGHLESANGYLDSVLDLVSQLPILLPKSAKAHARSIAGGRRFDTDAIGRSVACASARLTGNCPAPRA